MKKTGKQLALKMCVLFGAGFCWFTTIYFAQEGMYYWSFFSFLGAIINAYNFITFEKLIENAKKNLNIK